jgi:hypothetical protein
MPAGDPPFVPCPEATHSEVDGGHEIAPSVLAEAREPPRVAGDAFHTRGRAGAGAGGTDPVRSSITAVEEVEVPFAPETMQAVVDVHTGGLRTSVPVGRETATQWAPESAVT